MHLCIRYICIQLVYIRFRGAHCAVCTSPTACWKHTNTCVYIHIRDTHFLDVQPSIHSSVYIRKVSILHKLAISYKCMYTHCIQLTTCNVYKCMQMYSALRKLTEKTNVYNSIQKCSSPRGSKSSSTCNHREGEKDVNYCIHFILHRNICIHLHTFVYIERSDDPNLDIYGHIQCIHKNMYTSFF